jgi:hypothetical protein
MKKYLSMPRQLVDGWAKRTVTHPAGEQIAFHYHEVDEWLEVLTGEISFFSVGGRGCRLGDGEALWIPRGEVHRVEIGAGGAEYRMWLPVDVRPSDFSLHLAREDLSLVEENLKLPAFENLLDKKKRGESVHQDPEEFISSFVAPGLTFRAGDGSLRNSRGPASAHRIADHSIRILDKRGESVLLSTVVHVVQNDRRDEARRRA